MVEVLLYGYCTGESSSRRIAQRLHEDIAFRVLAANNTPDFRTISDFRKDHLKALADLFHQVLEALPEGGAGEAGPLALGQHQGQGQRLQLQGMSYGRMKGDDQLEAEVDDLLRRAQAQGGRGGGPPVRPGQAGGLCPR